MVWDHEVRGSSPRTPTRNTLQLRVSYDDAGVTQSVEFLPSKQAVAGSSPVSRSTSSTAALAVLHRPQIRKRAVMTDRDGGFFPGRKASNEHLPSFSGNHLPRVSLA